MTWKLYSTQFGLRIWDWTENGEIKNTPNFIGVNIIHSEFSWIIHNFWIPSCFVFAISWAFLFLMPKLDTTPKSLPNVLVVFTNVLLFLKGNIWRKKCKLRYIEMIFGSNAKWHFIFTEALWLIFLLERYWEKSFFETSKKIWIGFPPIFLKEKTFYKFR